MLLSLLFILTVQNVQTQHAYPWESAIWKKIVCQARQHITAQCFTAQVGIPHHDASDTLGLISSKRLHPRVRQNKFWSAQLHVQIHCEIAWALTVRMPSFILNFRRGFFFFPLLCKECHTMSKLHRLKSFVFGTLDISNVISVAVVWLICSRTTCLLFYSKSNLYHLVNTAISLTKESLPAPLCRTLVLLWFWRTSDHNPHNSNNRRRTISSSATLLFHVFTLEVFLKASNQYSSCWKAVNLK